MWKRTLTLILSILIVGGPMIAPATGKDYPKKPVEVLCPFPPGSMDVPLRVLAETVSKYLGQPLVVLNVPGAAGSIAAANLLNSPSDGYKLIQLDQLFFATIVKTQKIPFNPNDIVPIANYMSIKAGLAVRADSPWKTLEDLLNYGRKNPGKLRWATLAAEHPFI